MTICERLAIKLWLDGYSMDQIRGIYKQQPDNIYDFNRPEKHIERYLREILKDVL